MKMKGSLVSDVRFLMALIARIFVMWQYYPSHQNQGLGQAIVAKLVSLSVGHKKIILYAVPGKEGFYKKLGFKSMTTAMAIFENTQDALDGGYVREG